MNVDDTLLDVLRLLAVEAPAPEFSAAVERARQSGGDGAGEVLGLIFQIRDTLHERYRREREMGALEQTAADLVSLHDVDAVLQAIVRRARMLVGTDAAYLTLVDEDVSGRQLYTRVTDGITGSAFRDLRAVGIGALVLSAGRYFATSNYLADDRFDHTRVDVVVSEEGLVAVLAVPIVVKGETIGVLSTADRRERTFVKSQISLLTSLAAHAGVAIENARLFESAQRALADLRAANDEARGRREEAERTAELHEGLTRIVLNGGGVSEIAAAAAETVRRSMSVVDVDGRLLAQVDGARVSDAIASDALVSWQTPVVAGHDRLAMLTSDGPVPSELDVQLLERAAQVMALVLLQRRVLLEAAQQTRDELVRDLLAVPIDDPAGILERARSFGVDLSAAHHVAIGSYKGASRSRVMSASATLQHEYNGIVAEHGGNLVVLIPARADRADENTAEMFLRRLETELSAVVTATVSDAVASVEASAAALHDSQRCFRLLLALGRTGEIARDSDLGAYWLVLGSAESSDIERFIQTQLGAVIAHDERYNTELVRTLDSWFAERLNTTRCAQRLHVHVNTLYQRMARLDRILGDYWRTAEGGLHLQLALRLRQLREAGR